MSLIPQSDKDDLESVIREVHDTFKRLIYAHQDGELVVLSHDPNYNPFNPGNNLGDGVNSTITPNKIEFYGRILHGDKQHLRPADLADDSSLKLRIQDGEVRVKVDDTGKSVLDAAKKVEIDGLLYQFDTTARPHGLFSNQHYTYYLRKIE